MYCTPLVANPSRRPRDAAQRSNEAARGSLGQMFRFYWAITWGGESHSTHRSVNISARSKVRTDGVDQRSDGPA
jgi:hypothetical protein